jgi:hypothetical protein
MKERIIQGYISSVHGSSVGEQFYKTFSESDSFSLQNINALPYILKEITLMLLDHVFQDEEDIIDYKQELEDYISTY